MFDISCFRRLLLVALLVYADCRVCLLILVALQRRVGGFACCSSCTE